MLSNFMHLRIPSGKHSRSTPVFSNGSFGLHRERAAVLFVDFHGTLSNDIYWSTLQEPLRSKIQTLLFQENTSMVKSWMRGQLSSEEICQFVSDKLVLAYEQIWNGLVDSCHRIKISNWALRRIEQLRQDHVVCLITSNMDCFTRYVVPRKKLSNTFDFVFNSADFGLLKEDNRGELFRIVCKHLRVDIQECTLVDDSDDLCRLFEELGGWSRFVQGRKLKPQHLFPLYQLRLPMM